MTTSRGSVGLACLAVFDRHPVQQDELSSEIAQLAFEKASQLSGGSMLTCHSLQRLPGVRLPTSCRLAIAAGRDPGYEG